MRASPWARCLPGLVLFAVAACGGSNGPAGGGGGHGGAAGAGGSAGRGGAAGATAGAGGAGRNAAGAGGGGGSAAGAGGTVGATAGAGGSSGGAAGAAGAAGATGGTSGSAAGAGGTAGAATGGAGAGSGGSSAGGISGAGGSAGTGGAAGAPAFKLEYASTSTTATAFDLKLTVLGPSTPNVSAIKLRYYFTDDSGQGNVGAVIDLARWTIASTSTSIDLRGTGGCSVLSTTRKIPATSYADINCGLSSPVAAGDVLSFTIHFDPSENPANDYSFIDTAGALVANDHMLVTVNGLIVWGTPAP